MNSEMIRMWNEKVEPGDLVYILGDVAFCSASDAAKILQSLNGDKILVEGNHDDKSVKDVSFRGSFKEIHKYLEVNYNGTKVVMFHYPITEWNQMHRGSVHFYGHLHQNVSGLEKYRARNAGWDCTGNIVTLIDDMIADALKGEIKGHHV
jgi:calcineurin-like phosphoesterase family protein